jgi:hypothetical protein
MPQATLAQFIVALDGAVTRELETRRELAASGQAANTTP